MVFVETSLELSDDWRNFNSGEKDSFLSLEGNISWPFDESGEISSWLDIVTDSEISGFFFEKGISLLFYFFDLKSLRSKFNLIKWGVFIVEIEWYLHSKSVHRISL